MGIFNKSQEPATASGHTRTTSRGVPAEGAISIIGPGMQITGDLITDGTVRVEGRVEGTVQAGRAVVLSQGGEVVGNILTQDAVIGGRVEGTVIAENRLELQSTAILEGEVRARAQNLQLDKGARFNGQIHMIEDQPEPLRALPAEAATAEQGQVEEANYRA